jgi:hypothetical protein
MYVKLVDRVNKISRIKYLNAIGPPPPPAFTKTALLGLQECPARINLRRFCHPQNSGVEKDRLSSDTLAALPVAVEIFGAKHF